MNLLDSTIIDAIQANSNQHQEPSWFSQQRKLALKQIHHLKMPEVPQFKFSDWKLTPAIIPHMIESQATNELPKITNGIIQCGQTTIQINLDAKLVDQGVILTDIFTAVKKYPKLIKRYYMKQAVTAEMDQLASYHCAFMNNGIFLYVPQNVNIIQPLTATIIQDNNLDQPLIHHLLVIAESGSRLSLMTKLQAQGSNFHLANCVVEIIAQNDSIVNFSAIDELPESTMSYLNRRAIVQERAQVNWSIGLMNNGPTIADFTSELKGIESQSDAKVIAISSGNQHEGINTRVINRGRRSIGNIVQRGILLEQSQLTFNGIGHIIHGASGANAEQENRVLMLSDQARGDANPILLIDENDVLAGHAASVGQVDQEQMYYLMSRGIDPQTAQRLVIRGFLGPVIAGIPDKDVQKQLIATIERKLIHGQELK